MGNRVILGASRHPGRRGALCDRELPGRGPTFFSRLHAAVVVAGTLLTAVVGTSADKDPGIVIYTTLDHGRDETAIAVPFIKAERFALVTNVTTPDGKTVRVTNNQMKELVFPPDLTKATVTDDTGIAALRQKLAGFQAIQERFPRTHVQIAPVIEELGRTVRLLADGMVLVSGRFVSKADYAAQTSAILAKTVDLTVDEIVYKSAKLTSVKGDKISIMHSGGVASVAVGQLSDDQIARLNGTSKTAFIDKSTTTKSSATAPKQPAITLGANEPPTMPPNALPKQPETSAAAKATAKMSENAVNEPSGRPHVTRPFNPNLEPIPEGPASLNIEDIVDQLETESQLFGFEFGAYADLFGRAADFAATILAQKGTGDVSDYSRLAAAIAKEALTAASIANQSMDASALRSSADGRHVAVPSVDDLVEQNIQGAVAFAAYDRLALAMSFLADNRLSSEARDQHLLLIREMAEQASQDESNAVQARMRTNAEEDLIRQGFNAEEAKGMVMEQERRAGSSEGAAAMLRGMKDPTIYALARTSVREETRTRQGRQIDYYRKTVGIDEGHSDLLRTFFMAFGAAERDRIAQTLEEGDEVGLDEMFQDPDIASLLEGSGFTAESISTQLKEGGAALGKKLGFFNSEALLAKTLRNNVSVSDARAYFRDHEAATKDRKAKE